MIYAMIVKDCYRIVEYVMNCIFNATKSARKYTRQAH